MPLVYVVPGFAGSRLVSVAGLIDEVWPAPSLIAFGKIKTLGLAANGLDPNPDGGVECVAKKPFINASGHIINDGFCLYFYQALIDFLQTDRMKGLGWRTVAWPYDWRRRIKSLGLEFALELRRTYPAYGAHTIVAHSMGGLVSRVAWWSLVQTGQSHMVRRIITLATPHQGSYTTVQAILGQSPVIDAILAINQLARGIPATKGGLIRRDLTPEDIVQVSVTWPSLYDVLPLLGGSEAAKDPDRARLFDAANWSPSLHLNAAHLAYVRDSWSPFLQLPDTVPPYSVLTTVAGHGFGSGDGLAKFTVPLELSDLGFSGDTDTTVTGGSAIIERSRRYHFTGKHMSMPYIVTVSDKIQEMMDDTRDDVDPTAPVATIPTVFLEDPPWPPQELPVVGLPSNPCANGVCPC